MTKNGFSLPKIDLSYWQSEINKLFASFPIELDYAFQVGKSDATQHLVVCFALHENEVGSIPVVIEFQKYISKIINDLDLKISFILGNPFAFHLNKRFLKNDMNRFFVEQSAPDKELERIQGIMKIIKSGNFFIDFHQTIQPLKSPFFILENDFLSLNFAEKLNVAKYCIIDEPLPDGEKSATAFAQTLKIPAVNIEIGTCGINQSSYQIGMQCLVNFIQLIDGNKFESGQFNNKVLKIIKIVQRIPFVDPGDRLFEGLENLQYVAASTPIGIRVDGTAIIVNKSGYICFPKYPRRTKAGMSVDPIPSFICEIAG